MVDRWRGCLKMAASIRRTFQNHIFTFKNVHFMPTRGFHRSRPVLGAMDAEFEKAKVQLNTLQNEPGNDVKLTIYALFKQATIGKCNVKKPGMMDFVGKAKWDAWNNLSDMTQDEAQKAYIDLVHSLAGEDSPSQASVSSTESAGKYETVAVTLNDGIFKITLNRPAKKNAINYKMYEEVGLALSEAANDKNCTLAVLTGAGDYYCSGNDLSNFMNIPSDGIGAMAKQGGDILEKFVNAFIDFPKPLIGLINGPAVGVSVTVLGLFDVVYASDKATFHTPFSQLGQSPEGCSSYVFPKLMGTAKASEMLLFNKKITAQEACDRNLVSEVFPNDVFQRETEARVQQYAKLPKISLQKCKLVSRELEKDKLYQVNKHECVILMERWQSDECMNAIMGFFSSKGSKL
ncbi:enoyl-CoA delta isomerase 2-like isoform X1 [Mytilus edulis]|uniref:enoyl-CoA delta isomerase 2-like isoform X1 n=1 Tax=Mytilus edulis TaxID=6550 RepID=UPI0039EFF0E4